MDSKINPLIFYIFIWTREVMLSFLMGLQYSLKINRGCITVLRGGNTVSLNLYGVVSVFL